VLAEEAEAEDEEETSLLLVLDSVSVEEEEVATIVDEELVPFTLHPVRNKGVARAINDRYLFDFILMRSFHLINLINPSFCWKR
jgi:sulfur carrier protein ThiS